jgi:hypothetical protein
MPDAFWPENLIGWITMIAAAAWLPFMRWMAHKVNPADAIVKHLDQISDDLDKRPETLDPLEQEFQILEATVAQREKFLADMEVRKARYEYGKVITGQMRNGCCPHARLHLVQMVGKSVFVCRDCKQVVKTSARALE